ncbi:DUF1566 domain-containing protein [Psychroflexus planctonicus]|uniref:DUF1566 domain-containing protein n=1 Tax=Psychroflexus planctonicus TaxID=1526575 RepID=A0ABQ1SC14_9FLAO|nr:DUF1566 domain-containing protein [Psychroflexus planctonicus]GGE26678.1 hypothetical protein GCM10010832_04220 [Psychroflexus planctonicus]
MTTTYFNLKKQVISIFIILFSLNLSIAQVGIGTTTPDASASIELQSNTKGFLPPRMTTAERDDISSPAEGLTIYNTSNKCLEFYNSDDDWISACSGQVVTSPAIGMNYEGGIIFYVLQPGDQGYDPNVVHGLIASTSDQSEGIRWNRFDQQYVQTNASETAIGTGLSNTNAIISAQGTPPENYAASIASAYNGSGFNDWYLPSKDELNLMYNNKNLIGGFANWFYWSSSESSGTISWNAAYIQRFDNGLQQDTWRDGTYRVRAIRSF